MKNGFTLVELSIVLVIIGLLIGGILVGQSLIDSAKINQAVRQIQQYDIAVSNFQGKFRQLPGDSSLISPPGNNDGDPLDDTGETSCGRVICLEHYSFWKHLSDTKSFNEVYNNNASVNSDYLPQFLDIDFLEATYSTLGGFGVSTGWKYRTAGNDFFDGITLIAFDSKIDDGDSDTGEVRMEDVFEGDACSISDEGRCVISSITIMATTGSPLNN